MSYFEGSALVLLEALASRLALVQSRSSGSGVTPDTGIMLPEISSEAVAHAIRTVVKDRDQLNASRGNAQPEA